MSFKVFSDIKFLPFLLSAIFLTGGIYFFYQQSFTHQTSTKRVKSPPLEAETLLQGNDRERVEEITTDNALLRLEKVTSMLGEKYPELQALSQMSKEELEKVLSNPAEHQRLTAMAKEAQVTYFAEIREILHALPPDALEGVIEGFREHFTKTWGSEVADSFVIQFKQEFGL